MATANSLMSYIAEIHSTAEPRTAAPPKSAFRNHPRNILYRRAAKLMQQDRHSDVVALLDDISESKDWSPRMGGGSFWPHVPTILLYHLAVRRCPTIAEEEKIEKVKQSKNKLGATDEVVQKTISFIERGGAAGHSTEHKERFLLDKFKPRFLQRLPDGPKLDLILNEKLPAYIAASVNGPAEAKIETLFALEAVDNWLPVSLYGQLVRTALAGGQPEDALYALSAYRSNWSINETHFCMRLTMASSEIQSAHLEDFYAAIQEKAKERTTDSDTLMAGMHIYMSQNGRVGRLDKAMEALEGMQSQLGLVPNRMTYDILLFGAIRHRDLEAAGQILQLASDADIGESVFTAACIAEGQAISGDYEGMMQEWRNIVDTYGARYVPAMLVQRCMKWCEKNGWDAKYLDELNNEKYQGRTSKSNW